MHAAIRSDGITIQDSVVMAGNFLGHDSLPASRNHRRNLRLRRRIPRRNALLQVLKLLQLVLRLQLLDRTIALLIVAARLRARLQEVLAHLIRVLITVIAATKARRRQHNRSQTNARNEPSHPNLQTRRLHCSNSRQPSQSPSSLRLSTPLQILEKGWG